MHRVVYAFYTNEFKIKSKFGIMKLISRDLFGKYIDLHVLTYF